MTPSGLCTWRGVDSELWSDVVQEFSDFVGSEGVETSDVVVHVGDDVADSGEFIAEFSNDFLLCG